MRAASDSDCGIVMKNWRSRNVLNTELPKNVGTSRGRYEPTQLKCLYRMNSGISVQMKGRSRVASIT